MTPTDPDDAPAPAGAAPTTAPAARTPRPPPEEAKPRLSASERAARRRRRRTVVFWIVALAAIALALALIRCGGGFGFGDGSGLGGGGSGPGTGVRGALSAPGRCQLRVDVDGISLAGKPVSIDAAVAACIVASGAEIVVTGDARQGTWDALRARLDAAGIASLVHLAGAGAGAPGLDAGTGAP